MNFIPKLAESRSGGQVALREAWRMALTRLSSLHLNATSVEALAHACKTPTQVNLLAHLLRADPLTLSTLLHSRVDESDASLADWIEALEILQRWIESKNRTGGLTGMLGYIACTTEAAKEMSLPLAVSEMLDTYGFEG